MKAGTKLLQTQLSLAKPFISSCSLASARKGQDKIGLLMANTRKSDVYYRDDSINGMPVCYITPKDELSAGIILYLHGGGYTCGNLDYAKGFGTVLAAECGMKVLCIAYRLAPEHIFPAALDDSISAYEHLLVSGYLPSQIILCGESAGGGLCYSLCMKLSELSRPLPAGIVAISPWTDLSLSSESYVLNKSIDPSMSVERLKYFADCYMYGAKESSKELYPITCDDAELDAKNKREPYASPLFGSLCKMPPSLIFVGGGEIMLDDSCRMHEKLLASSCESELTIADGLWHGYILYALKERMGDFEKIRHFIKKNTSDHKKLRWMSLDNAAKIFPASRSRSWSNVFRLSATMTETVDRDTLASALDVTVRRFPSIAVRVRAGMFWYYLEEIENAPAIMDEKPCPLSRMPFDDIRKCAFRVIVYDKRIALEFFHALTDGNGGLIFLKTLVAEYIRQKYGVTVPIGDGVLDRLTSPSEGELEDSFFRYSGKVAASRAAKDAFRIKGEKEIDGFKTNTTFIIDSDVLLEKAKEKGVTVTAYLTAALILAVIEVQKNKVRRPSRYKPVMVLLPVNLRKIFPSGTLRNFVLYATVGVDQRLGEYTFDELIKIVHHQMNLQITPKNMAAMIATNVNNEKPFILKITPLFLKNIVMNLIFTAVGERKSCFSFSNLGAVRLPDEFERYVDRMDFVLSCQRDAPYNTSLISFKGKTYLNIIRNISESLLEKELHSVLLSLGIVPTLESNLRPEKKKKKKGDDK